MSDVQHTDHEKKPSGEGLEPHQHWVWLAGATPPHWEVRGTGVAKSATDAYLDYEYSRSRGRLD
jgi:hypothetical protein